jgi:hypothetical protein
VAWSEEYRIAWHGVGSLNLHGMKSILYTHKAWNEEFKILWHGVKSFKIEGHRAKSFKLYGMG